MSEWGPGRRRAALASAVLVVAGVALTLLVVLGDLRSPGVAPDDNALRHATQRLAVKDADPGPRPFPLGLLVLGGAATLVAGVLPWGVLAVARLRPRPRPLDGDA